MRWGLVAGWVLLLTLGGGVSAQAHLMGKGHCTLNIVKNKAYIVMSVSVSVFSESGAAEAVSDGVLTAKELRTHSEALRKAIRSGLTVRDGDVPVTFSSILLNLPKGDHHPTGRSAELTAMIVAPLRPKAGESGAIEVENTLWAPTERRLKLRATVTEAGRTLRNETVELTPAQGRHRFFGSSMETPSVSRD